MARPTFTNIQSGTQTWLSDFNDAIQAIYNTPFPIPTFANEAAFPVATMYEDCLAFAEDVDTIFKSDGTDWIEQPKLGTAVADASGWSDSTAQTDFNALLAVLQAANIIL